MNNMSDEEFCKALCDMHDEMMRTRRDSDYVVNNAQMRRFRDLCQIFFDMAEKFDDVEIEPIVLRPIEEHGGLTVKMQVLYLCGRGLKQFCDILQYASAMTIDPTIDDKICLSFTVPYVFVRKDKIGGNNYR